MTLRDLELKNRVDAFSRLGQDAKCKDEQYRVLYFRFDISGWNSLFREESCSMVTTLLDQIHGSRFYSTVMPAFQHIAFYAPTRTGCESWEGLITPTTNRYPKDISRGFIGAKTGSRLQRERLWVEHDSQISMKNLDYLKSISQQMFAKCLKTTL